MRIIKVTVLVACEDRIQRDPEDFANELLDKGLDGSDMDCVIYDATTKTVSIEEIAHPDVELFPDIDMNGASFIPSAEDEERKGTEYDTWLEVAQSNFDRILNS